MDILNSNKYCILALILAEQDSVILIILLWRGTQKIVTYAVVEKGRENKEEQRWALVEPWILALELLLLEKSMSQDEETLNRKPVAWAISELRLSKAVSQ